MNGKVSIVIPLYNGESYIEQTLNNILKSSYDKLEIIIVNDGSTDRSLQICENIQKRDKRIVIFTKENGGIVSARNYGVSRANGEYLCFCDQDDIVESDMYRKMIACMEKTESDICMCSTGRSIGGRQSVYEVFDNANYTGDEILKYLLFPLVFNGYTVPVEMGSMSRYPDIWNCMFSIKFWHQFDFHFRSYVNFEDDLLLKIDALSRAQKVSTIAYVGYYWRVNMKSESYAHKYVKDIAFKQQQCYEDMKHCFIRRVQNQAVIDMFTKVVKCKQYLDAVHNITSPAQRKNISYIKQYYQEEIYDNDFNRNIEFRKYVKKGSVKPMILLPLLARKLTLLSYVIEKILNCLLLFSLNSHRLTVIERRLKNIRSE